ncbi:hypothetical protein [Chitinophaga sp. S165]|uniref:hypothetical protein n=1 Tax=Chitinophaga sp. S165 TaxID=2135462 RepID=UPI0011B5C74A|nr:hypothetical protein [Chitinophaga sp. S165]
MRYAFICYILLLQLLWQSATEPKVYAAGNKALQEESAGISESSVTPRQYGEITPFLQFNGTISKVNGQRLHDGLASILNLSSYLSIQVSKATTAFSSPPRFPLVRLLLFPHHYFW